MDILEDQRENDWPLDKCSQFMHKVNELMNNFNHYKLTSECFLKYTDIKQHFISWLELLETIRVWPPSVNLLIPELTLVCNCLLVDISWKSHLGGNCTLVSTQFSHFVSKTLTRVLHFAVKILVADNTYHRKNTDIETLMMAILKTVEDPIARFKLVDCLGQLVLLCSICCIDKRQRDGSEKTSVLLSVLDQLMKIVGQSVLQDVLPYRQGLVMCKLEETKDMVIETNLCVADIARLVMLSCHLKSDDSMKLNQWQWLDTFLQCKKLIIEKQYTIAMKKLEAELSQPIDPEQKSILLCQFAECYLHQGCPQLAVQTFKDALTIYRRPHSILVHLANVYNIMGQEELELESLNLLVKELSDEFMRSEQQPFTTEIDAIIVSVFQVMPSVTYSCAVHFLARCCTKLHRYKEAADHYLKLLKLLQNPENFTSRITKSGPLLATDVKELVVEAVEALSLAQQNTKCLLLCDEFYPILSSEHITSHSSSDICVNNFPGEDFNFNNSQHSLFDHDQSQHSEFAEEILTSSVEHEASLTGKLKHSVRLETVNHGDSGLTLKSLSNFINLSRLKVTSESDDQYTFPHSYSNKKDVWWSKSLPVRLLLSKADVLVATQGFTDETFDCLTKAFNLLMDSETSIFAQGHNALESPCQPPVKRRKIVSTDIMYSQQSKVAVTQGKPQSGEKLERFCSLKVSTTWKKYMMNVLLRMAQASLKRLQMSSVLNSCHLILQLDPHNTAATYMKTVVLQDRYHQNDMASKLWLQERGIDCNSSETILRSLLEEKQKEVRNSQSKQATESKKWWQISEFQMKSLDVTCLKNIIQLVQKQTETS